MNQTTIFEFEDGDDGDRCPNCGASMKSYWFKITPGLVKALVKMADRIRGTGVNRVHKKELPFGHSEYGNFQKLRFFGLIDKYRENGVWRRGDWCLTLNTVPFLNGMYRVPDKIRVFRNEIIEKSPNMVTIHEIMKGDEWFQTVYQHKIMRTV